MRKHYGRLMSSHGGKVIAIVNEKIVGVGDTLQEAQKKAKAVTSKKPFFGRIRKEGAMIL